MCLCGWDKCLLAHPSYLLVWGHSWLCYFKAGGGKPLCMWSCLGWVWTVCTLVSWCCTLILLLLAWAQQWKGNVHLSYKGTLKHHLAFDSYPSLLKILYQIVYLPTWIIWREWLHCALNFHFFSCPLRLCLTSLAALPFCLTTSAQLSVLCWW